MNLFVWAILLVFQTAAFTWVSRARNSGSISYHAIASVFSNGIWFVSQFFFIDMMVKPGMTWQQATKIGVTYTVATVIGAVIMHYAAMRWMESGKRKVGA